jgi:hypothetical protein
LINKTLKGRNFVFATLALMISGSTLFTRPTDAAETAPSGKQQSTVLKGGVTTFGVLTEQLQSDIGLNCKRDGAGAVMIGKVQAGREAYYAGIQEGDKILSARIEGKELQIGLQRDGHVFLAKLKVLGAGQTIAAKVTQAAPAPIQPLLAANAPINMLQLTEDQNQLIQSYAVEPRRMQQLAHYNFQIIMDRSLSMQARDCPLQLSRWDWCGAQAAQIAKGLEPFVSNGLTLIPFNHGFDIYENATPHNIIDVFNDHGFKLGTYLYEPLANRFDEFFKNTDPKRKPLLLVVITDGEPWPNPQPEMVKAELVNASQRMTNPDELIVVFLQIGDNDKHGRDYLVDLGGNLMGQGGKFQYIHTRTFDELKQTGLANAIVSTVEQYAPRDLIAPKESKPEAKNNKVKAKNAVR